jgi:circadian clock protein KaiC
LDASPIGRADRQLPKTPTGIIGLDKLTFGGLPTGHPTLLCGAAGCGKTLFAMTFLVDGATSFGEAGVFTSFEERAVDLEANVASLGYDVQGLKGRFERQHELAHAIDEALRSTPVR